MDIPTIIARLQALDFPVAADTEEAARMVAAEILQGEAEIAAQARKPVAAAYLRQRADSWLYGNDRPPEAVESSGGPLSGSPRRLLE